MQQRDERTMRRLAVATACAAMTACGGGGGGGGDSDAGDAFSATARTFQVTGSEAAADLSSTDTALAAALAAIALSRAVNGLGIAQFDNGSRPAGSTTQDCDAGTVTIDVASSAVQRVFALTGDQCWYGSNGRVIDGVIQRTTTQLGNPIAGTLSAGAGALPAVIAHSGTPYTAVEVRASGGQIAFQGQSTGSPFATNLAGASVLTGQGDAPAAGTSFIVSKWFEALVGSGASFELAANNGSSATLTMNGPLSVRGQGLAAACNLSASYVVTTTVPVVVTNAVVKGGSITLTTPAGMATVEFLADGRADVTPSSGTGKEYTAAQVAAFCGLSG